MLPAGRRLRPSWLAQQDWLLAVALAFFVGVSVWFGRAIEDFLAPSGNSVGAPSFVGETLSDALATAERARLKATVVQRIASDRYPRDVVMRQDPRPGALVREGRQISLVVSTGVVIFPMPDLRYESMREVGLDLSHFKLQLGKVRSVSNEEVPANRVVSQNPPPLSSVRPGTVVNVELSKGTSQTVRVPDFGNMSIDEARLAADDARIHLGQIVWTPFGRNGPPRGEVVRQDPRAGAAIDSSQLVSLQISAGPREAGYIVRQVHATATVPEPIDPGGKPAIVRLEVRDDTGTWNVYNAYAEPKQKLDFNLTVVGTAELDMYVNNELLSATRLGVEPPVPARPRATPRPEESAQP
jgi:beta-lactam-binding protein with PASTA domain